MIMFEPLSISSIKKYLSPDFQEINIVVMESASSTNTLAKEMAEKERYGERNANQNSSEIDSVLITDHQTEGRGRGDNSWESPSGVGIYMSLILYPDSGKKKIQLLNLSVAIGIVEALQAQTGIFANLKWPNDILIGSKKIGGVLIECGTGECSYMVIGIGINLNTKPEDLSTTVRKISSSLFESSGVSYDRNRIIPALIESVNKWVNITDREPDSVIKRWKELAGCIGSEVSVNNRGMNSIGVIRDIDSEGFMMLEKKDGEIERILSANVISR